MAIRATKKKAASRKGSAKRAALTPSASDSPPIKGQTLRLNMDAWRQLKIMAIDQGVPAHDLLIEAVNGYFRRHGKPPLA